jgi:S-layer like family, C-terminal region
LRDLENNKQCLVSIKKIYCRSNSIQDHIDELYQDIVSAAKHFEDAIKLDFDDASRDAVNVWDTLTDEAISTSRSCIRRINHLLNYGPPDAKYFEELRILDSLMSLGRFTIIVGCKPSTEEEDHVSEPDYMAAKRLQEYLNAKINRRILTIKAIVERGKEQQKDDPIKIERISTTLKALKGYNLILIGGPRPNLLTKEINSYMLVPYMQYGKLNGFYSRITEQSYTQGDGGKSWSVIQGIRNPFNLNRVVILVYGLTREGTTKAIEELINRMDMYLKNKEESLQIETKRQTEKRVYPAKIFEV